MYLSSSTPKTTSPSHFMCRWRVVPFITWIWRQANTLIDIWQGCISWNCGTAPALQVYPNCSYKEGSAGLVMLQDVPKVSWSRTFFYPHRLARGADDLTTSLWLRTSTSCFKNADKASHLSVLMKSQTCWNRGGEEVALSHATVAQYWQSYSASTRVNITRIILHDTGLASSVDKITYFE